MVCQSVARIGKALLGLFIVCSSLGFSAQNHNDGCAAGLFYMSGDGETTNLRNGNGDREYSVGAVNFQVKCQLGGVPIAFGTDFYSNFKDYDSDSNDPYTAVHHNEDYGYVLSIVVGKLKAPGDWLLGYYYANIEALAVNASFCTRRLVQVRRQGRSNGFKRL